MLLFAIDCNATEYTKNQGALLQILNKLTTKNYLLSTPLGQSVDLDEGEIIIYQCLSLDKEKSNEAIALLKFTSKLNINNKFLGWLIKSSPSLVSIEDPVYDIKLVDCLSEDPLFPSLKEIN